MALPRWVKCSTALRLAPTMLIRADSRVGNVGFRQSLKSLGRPWGLGSFLKRLRGLPWLVLADALLYHIHLPVCLWIMDPHSRAPKKNTSHGNEVLPQVTMYLIQRPCYQRGSPCQDPAGNRTTRRPRDHRKETQIAVVWLCFPFIRSGQNHLARHSERGRKTRQTEEEVGRQHQGMDRPGVRRSQVTAWLTVLDSTQSTLFLPFQMKNHQISSENLSHTNEKSSDHKWKPLTVLDSTQSTVKNQIKTVNNNLSSVFTSYLFTTDKSIFKPVLHHSQCSMFGEKSKLG